MLTLNSYHVGCSSHHQVPNQAAEEQEAGRVEASLHQLRQHVQRDPPASSQGPSCPTGAILNHLFGCAARHRRASHQAIVRKKLIDIKQCTIVHT